MPGKPQRPRSYLRGRPMEGDVPIQLAHNDAIVYTDPENADAFQKAGIAKGPTKTTEETVREGPGAPEVWPQPPQPTTPLLQNQMNMPEKQVTATAPSPQWAQAARREIYNQNMGQPIPYQASDLDSPPWAVQARRSIYGQNLGQPTNMQIEDFEPQTIVGGQPRLVTIAHPVTGNRVHTTPKAARQLITAGHAVPVPNG